MKKVMSITMVVLAGLMFASSGFAQARNFRHERIIATDGFTGDGASISNVAGGNIATGNIDKARLTNALASAGADIGGNIPIASITNAIPTAAALAVNNGTSLTGVTAMAMSAAGLTAGTVASAIDGSAITNLTLGVGSVVQAYSANLDKLALNDGGSLTNVTVSGGSIGGHTLYVWTGPTCSTYNVSADGLHTNWMGDTFP